MEFFIPIRNRHTAAAPGTFGICGNSGDTVRFDFDAEWDPYPEKTAFFFWDTPQTHAETAVLFQGTRCPVPVITTFISTAAWESSS